MTTRSATAQGRVPVKVSDPFQSADGRTTYVTELKSGTRRRVEIINGEVFFAVRQSKAQRKAEKRARRRA